MIRKILKKKWKPRKKTAHKGDFGRVLLLAGSRGLTGAAYLSSLACVRAGAGLVTLGCPEKVYPILARRSQEVMVKPFPSTREGSFSVKALGPILRFLKNQNVLAIGPGLSQDSDTQKLVRRVLAKSVAMIVIDADGLNALKGHTQELKKCIGRAVITPHPGEFVRLFGGKLSDSDKVRRKRAVEVAKKYHVVVVLKGHRTVVADPRGKVYINRTGNPGMATGGTGDVLTGIIAALIGQKFSLFDAACFGVYLHGLSGDRAAKKVGEVSLAAGDLIEALPAAIQSVLGA
ncbi:MAG: NAD(P)H-hydrate dehydratase [Candidatus Omnitrophica bacterium]|nr:NAD(P)H-hydrate dehydratase [Candidatus Omnitrophota bacterium]